MAVKAAKPSFEDMMKRLETIVGAMETGTMPLEESLKSFEEAMALSKKLEELLAKSRTRVMELTGRGEETPLKQEDLQ